MPPTRSDLDDALAGVRTPDGTPLARSGRLRAVVLREDRVGFAIAVAPQEAEAFEPVRRAAQEAVGTLEGVGEVLVALLAEDEDGTATPGPAREAGDTRGIGGRARALAGRIAGRKDAGPGAAQASVGARAPARSSPGQNAASSPAKPSGANPARRQGPLPGVQRIVAVGSGKGGVGKSTVSVNLALALSALGWRVGLLDADIYGPSVPRLLGAEAHRPQPGGGLAPLEAFAIKAMSIGFLVAPEQAVVWRGPMATGALGQLLRDTKWGALDCLVIDMPPGTGDIQLSLAQTVPVDGAVVVTTPQDLALLDVRKAAEMFDRVHVPILGVVENMAGFVCPHCGGHSAIFGEGGGAREAEARGVPLLGAIPLTMAIREASDAGRPVAAEGGAAAAPYVEIASNLMARLAAAAPKPFPKIVFED